MSPVLRACACILAFHVLKATAAQVSFAKKTSPETPMMTSASGLLEEMKEMASSGEKIEPAKVTEIKAIIDTLKVDLGTTRTNALAVTITNVAALNKCNSDKATRATAIATTKTEVEREKAAHAVCRHSEKDFHATSKCRELDTTLASYAVQGTAPALVDGKPPRAATVEWVAAMKGYWCPKGTVIDTLDGLCEAETLTQAAANLACDTNQGAFESDFCTWRTQVVDMCTTHGQCYTSKTTDYTTQKAATTALVPKWKLELQALEKITCYLLVWESGGDTPDNTQFDACNAATPVTTDMDVDWTEAQYTAGAESACETVDELETANYPGTAGFVTDNYNTFHETGHPDNKLYVPITACLNVESGAVATGDRDADGGHLTAAGALVESSSKAVAADHAIEAEIVEADGTVHPDHHGSQLGSMGITQLMQLAKSLGGSTKELKALLASSILKQQSGM